MGKLQRVAACASLVASAVLFSGPSNAACPPLTTSCFDICCAAGTSCCPTPGGHGVCAPPGWSCCPGSRDDNYRCDNDSVCCGKQCCSGAGKCCGDMCCHGLCCGGTCHTEPGTCCGTDVCRPGTECCGGTCVTAGTCCGGTTCSAGQSCCGGACVPSSYLCCDGTPCGPGGKCCPGGVCAEATATCCGPTSCPAGQTCCADGVCASPAQICCGKTAPCAAGSGCCSTTKGTQCYDPGVQKCCEPFTGVCPSDAVCCHSSCCPSGSKCCGASMCCSVIDPYIGRRFGKYGRDFLIHRLKCQNPTIPQLDVIKHADTLIKWGMTLGDPVDPNYQEIAQMQAPPLPSIQGAPPIVAQPLQWVLELEWQLASVHAARVVSLDRALGAGLAHDDYWEETQIWIAQWYSYWAAWLTYQLPQALTDLRVALEAVQYTCQITPTDREAYMTDLLQNGMAPDFEQAYVDFGFPVARLPEAYAFLIDTEMLEPADVTYSPGVLDDPIMVQGIYDYANQLQQYAFTPAFHGAPPQ